MSSLREIFEALRRDLIHDGGPSISTTRNYPFAIVQYDPVQEFELRAEVQRLVLDLRGAGWRVTTIDLQKLLFARLRAEPNDFLEQLIEYERRARPDRRLTRLHKKLAPFVEGEDGLARDCVERIEEIAEAYPDDLDRTLALVGRAGALYPFFRASALLKRLDRRTQGVPVVLLYPGERRGKTGLSFMGMFEPETDYRPRIYS